MDPSAALAELLRDKRVAVLTGAGVSTESGIPDYRSPEALARTRKPIHGPEFVLSAQVRKRYWARSLFGWESMRRAEPGPAHRALARLEQGGVVSSVITQNVDRLHHAAGSRKVIELHGALAEVTCLRCGVIEARDALQARLRDANRGLLALAGSGAAVAAPDGDADLSDDLVARFEVPSCVVCGGVLKPRVVFFGDNVAREVVERAFAEVDLADALLVAGTSLAVYSGYRFLLRAAQRDIPIAIVNRGQVRGEQHAELKIDASTGMTLEALANRLLPRV